MRKEPLLYPRVFHAGLPLDRCYQRRSRPCFLMTNYLISGRVHVSGRFPCSFFARSIFSVAVLDVLLCPVVLFLVDERARGRTLSWTNALRSNAHARSIFSAAELDALLFPVVRFLVDERASRSDRTSPLAHAK